MARLKSELEVICPCCQSVLVIDLNLGRVVSHSEPDRGNKPELSDAQRILAESMRQRQACFWATPCGRGCSIKANYQSTTVHLPPALATGCE